MLSIFKRNVYLDNNATTYVSSSVRKTMKRVLKYHWGNPSSGYQKGKNAFQIMEQARERVAKSIHAHSHVLKAIGLSDKAAEETIRISLGKDTKMADIAYTLRVIEKYLK